MPKLLGYWPSFYREIFDFQELDKTQSIQLDSLEAAIDLLFNEQFVMTSSEYGVRRRERVLNIKADPSVESLDFRKKRIINRYSIKPPFTIRYLQKQLDFLIGEGRAVAEVDVQNFILYVNAEIEDASVFKEIQHTVNTIKPANIEYNQKTSLCDGIVFEEEMYKVPLTRMTRLSTQWRLGKTPFMQRGEKEIIHRAPLHRPTKLSTQWRLGKTSFVEQGVDA